MKKYECETCRDSGWVCEAHPNLPWLSERGGCQCNAGMPCECELRLHEQAEGGLTVDIDCGDNSCRFATNRGGMRTNGGCRCFENAGFGPSAVGAALKMLPEITRLRAEVEKLRRVRDAAAEWCQDHHWSVCGAAGCTWCCLRAALDAAQSD